MVESSYVVHKTKNLVTHNLCGMYQKRMCIYACILHNVQIKYGLCKVVELAGGGYIIKRATPNS